MWILHVVWKIRTQLRSTGMHLGVDRFIHVETFALVNLFHVVPACLARKAGCEHGLAGVDRFVQRVVMGHDVSPFACDNLYQRLELCPLFFDHHSKDMGSSSALFGPILAQMEQGHWR